MHTWARDGWRESGQIQKLCTWHMLIHQECVAFTANVNQKKASVILDLSAQNIKPMRLRGSQNRKTLCLSATKSQYQATAFNFNFLIARHHLLFTSNLSALCWRHPTPQTSAVSLRSQTSLRSANCGGVYVWDPILSRHASPLHPAQRSGAGR
jgi:hypothetical protein